MSYADLWTLLERRAAVFISGAQVPLKLLRLPPLVFTPPIQHQMLSYQRVTPQTHEAIH